MKIIFIIIKCSSSFDDYLEITDGTETQVFLVQVKVVQPQACLVIRHDIHGRILPTNLKVLGLLQPIILKIYLLSS